MNLHSIDRRSFLQGVGVALALPMLKSRARGVQPQRPRRILAIGNHLGFYPPDDVPAIEPDVRGVTNPEGTTDQAPCRRHLRPVPQQDRPAGLRPGELRPHRRLARSIRPQTKGGSFRHAPRRQDLRLQRRVQEVGCCAGGYLHPLSHQETAHLRHRSRTGLLGSPAIDAVLREMKQDNKGLRDLIEAVVLSEVFGKN
jgi:hypothetical protein